MLGKSDCACAHNRGWSRLVLFYHKHLILKRLDFFYLIKQCIKKINNEIKIQISYNFVKVNLIIIFLRKQLRKENILKLLFSKYFDKDF